jgi:hypothetical protein
MKRLKTRANARGPVATKGVTCHFVAAGLTVGALMANDRLPAGGILPGRVERGSRR